jgi:hypothetical protein
MKKIYTIHQRQHTSGGRTLLSNRKGSAHSDTLKGWTKAIPDQKGPVRGETDTTIKAYEAFKRFSSTKRLTATRPYPRDLLVSAEKAKLEQVWLAGHRLKQSSFDTYAVASKILRVVSVQVDSNPVVRLWFTLLHIYQNIFYLSDIARLVCRNQVSA